ncbi:MAG: phage baseplate plug family protein [Kofleriaceae bacterium]
MAITILPFGSDQESPSGNYEFEATIEDVPYKFDVRWNQSDRDGQGAWYFDLSESDGQTIARGLKIVVGTYIGRNSAHPLFERGVIAAIDTSGEYRDPGFEDLGKGRRVEVRYYTVEDLVAEVYGI